MANHAGGRHAALAALWLAAAPAALAAGGHHGVEDAQILPRGECEQEIWFTRARGGGRLLHAGGSCRVGGVELGASGEYGREDDGSQTAWSAEAKWAREVADGFSIGMHVQPVWRTHVRPRYQGTAVLGLATWSVHEDVDLHLNLGRDIVHQGRDQKRGGLALEWKPAKDWSLVAERYREDATHFARAGVRWAAGRNWSVDLSRAQRLAGPVPSNWTLGLTFALDDD